MAAHGPPRNGATPHGARPVPAHPRGPSPTTGVCPHDDPLPRYDQNRYAPGGYAPSLSMDTTGMLYTPSSCAAGAPCKLVVARHGCLSGQYLLGDAFPALGNLDTYADTDNLVVLHPQAISSVLPVNPEGCWDWWGYDGSNFAVRSAPQMTAIVNMVHALGG